MNFYAKILIISSAILGLLSPWFMPELSTGSRLLFDSGILLACTFIICIVTYDGSEDDL